MNIQRQSWKISRRTALKGAGALLGLPLLEAMVPLRATAAGAAKAPVRMACLFFPNGVNPSQWTPKGEGSKFELSPILQPLAEHRGDINVLTNLWNKTSNGGDGHYAKVANWLTCLPVAKTTGKDLNVGGPSVDQVAAKAVGGETILPSMELGVDPVATGVDTNVNYTRLYASHIAWSSPTTPLPCEINPRLAFDRIFRQQARSGQRSADDKSVLDLVLDDAKRLRDQLGSGDQQKLDQYLESVRAVEKRIEADEKRISAGDNVDPAAQKAVEALNARINKAFGNDDAKAQLGSMPRFDHTEHCQLMLDLIALAFWTDSTRVSTFMFGNAVSGKNFSFLDGVQGAHHEISHHKDDAKQLDMYAKINAWHTAQYAYLLNQLKAMKEGGGTVLDNSMVLFGSAIRDGNQHNPHNIPVVLAGKGGGAIQTGRHLVYDNDTPLANLYVAMLKAMGVNSGKFGDSEGALPRI